MDECQHSIPEVAVPLGKCHVHRVRVERQAENAGLIQQSPHHAATSLAGHEPLHIGLLVLKGHTFAHILIGFGAFLALDVERVVVGHTKTLLVVGGPMDPTHQLAAVFFRVVRNRIPSGAVC